MIESLARMASTASTRIFQHQRSDPSVNDGHFIVDARRKAIRFMERGRWEKFHELLLSAAQADEAARIRRKNDRRERRNSVGGSADSSDSSGGPAHLTPPLRHNLLDLDSDCSNLLHVLVAYRAPVDAVLSLDRTFPSMIQCADLNGLTPLHRAVRSSARLEIIACLLELYPPAADARDDRGRTPLVQACVEMGLSSERARSHGGNPIMAAPGFRYATELVRMLANASPRSVTVEDEEGRTALEHAIDALAPKNTVRMLQRATIVTAREDESEERRRRLSDRRRVREEAQKKWGQAPMPQHVAFEEWVARRSIDGYRMVATGA